MGDCFPASPSTCFASVSSSFIDFLFFIPAATVNYSTASGHSDISNLFGGGRMHASGLILCFVGTHQGLATSPYRWFSWKPPS